MLRNLGAKVVENGGTGKRNPAPEGGSRGVQDFLFDPEKAFCNAKTGQFVDGKGSEFF